MLHQGRLAEQAEEAFRVALSQALPQSANEKPVTWGDLERFARTFAKGASQAIATVVTAALAQPRAR